MAPPKKESDSVLIARIDENVKTIKEDYVTTAEMKNAVSDSMVYHERKKHGGISFAMLWTMVTLIGGLLGAGALAFFGG